MFASLVPTLSSIVPQSTESLAESLAHNARQFSLLCISYVMLVCSVKTI